MANELRLRVNNVSGAINDNPLTNVATTINSPMFADLPVVDNTNHLILVLDPLEVYGAAEAVMVTAHTASATSVTAVRGQESSVARQHPLGTTWFHGPVVSDWNFTQRTALSTNRPSSPFNGELIYETNTNRWSARSSAGTWLPAPFNVPMVRVLRSANQTLTNGVGAGVSFDVESLDTDNMWVVGSPTRVTFQTTGTYLITYGVQFASNGTGARSIYILLAGVLLLSTMGAVPGNATDGPALVGSVMRRFSAADFIELFAVQNSGGNLNIGEGGSGHERTYLTALWVGP